VPPPAETLTRPGPPAAARPRAPRVVGSLMFVVAGLILGLMATLPYLAHRRSATWPVATGTVLAREVVTLRASHKGPSYIVRDSYRVPGLNGPTTCHWDDPLGTGIRRWIDARLQTRDRNWPVGSQASLHAEPHGDRCEPVGGFERAVRPTVAVVALAALACLGGLAFLWRPAPPLG
jgi:hypothetical protein